MLYNPVSSFFICSLMFYFQYETMEGLTANKGDKCIVPIKLRLCQPRFMFNVGTPVQSPTVYRAFCVS